MLRALLGTGVLLVAVGFCVLAFLATRPGGSDRSPGGERGEADASRQPHRTPDPREPAPDFATFVHVVGTGGDRLSRDAAITWLDTLARERKALDPDEETGVMQMIRREEFPESWTPGYRLHLFNSAFNALHRAPSPDEFNRELHRLLERDPDPDMRLYALQHIRTQRNAGRLAGDEAGAIHATLQQLADDAAGRLAGLAVTLLIEWDGGGDARPVETALATAADRERAADVRVSALHAAGEEALGLARTISADSGEPVILRKAAIARMGSDGGSADVPALESLLRINARLDQAVVPALARLRERLENPHTPQPVPYRTVPIP